MRCVIRGASIAAVGILASLAIAGAGCDNNSKPTTSTSISPNRPIAQYNMDAGLPNQIPNTPEPGPTNNPANPVNPTNPGSPINPGSPSNPNAPGTPGMPGNPGNPANPNNPGSPGSPGSPPLGH